jgi:hypothetical protein
MDILKPVWESLHTLLRQYNYLTRELRFKRQECLLHLYLIQARDLKSTRLAPFYMLWKIHKDPIVGRPIVSSCATATEAASKLLDRLLQPLLKLICSHCPSSTRLLLDLETFVLPQGHILLVADITSLYPSIPLEPGLDALRAFLERHHELLPEIVLFKGEKAVRLSVDFIVDLARWVLTNNITRFGNQVYKQQSGTAMGTSFAVAYAVIFVDHVEEQALTILPKESVSLYRRYIDDLFLCINNNVAQLFIDSFNSIYPTIRLDAYNISNTVVFLDVRLCINPDNPSQIISELYSKEQNRYLYLCPISLHAKHVFLAFIRAEIDRIRLLDYYDDQYHIDKRFFFRALRARGYPAKYLDPIFINHNPNRYELLRRARVRADTPKPSHRQAPAVVFKIVHSHQSRSVNVAQALDIRTLPPSHRYEIFRDRAPTLCWLNSPKLGSYVSSNLFTGVAPSPTGGNPTANPMSSLNPTYDLLE